MRTFYPQTCEYCHVEFQYTRTHPRKYCSHKCSVDANRTGYKKKNGYVCTMVDGANYEQHRLIMERHIGRKLRYEEVVHHKDRNHSNNAIENLQLFACAADHVRQHYIEDRGITATHAICICCKESKLHSEFPYRKCEGVKIRGFCKNCDSIRSKKYRERKLAADAARAVTSA